MDRQDIQLEALAATDGKQRCSVVLGTGVGKTLVGLNHMDRNTTPLNKILFVKLNFGLNSNFYILIGLSL